MWSEFLDNAIVVENYPRMYDRGSRRQASIDHDTFHVHYMKHMG